MTPTDPRVTLRGARLDFRPVTPDDAAYVLKLRSDPAHAAHLSPVTGTVADQAAWIARCKAREAAGEEVYHVIQRKDATPCGLVRLYDIRAETFTWGSWILDAGKPAKAALDSAVMVYDWGFTRLGLGRAVFAVDRANARVLAFHDRFGATRTGADARDIHYVYDRDRFLADRPGFRRVLGADPRGPGRRAFTSR